MERYQVAILRDSLVEVLDKRQHAAAIFYNRLFELDPGARALFHSDMDAQGEKLILMLADVITGLDRMDDMTPQLQALYTRHCDYGVRDEQYAAAGEALCHMTATLADPRHASAVEDAWRRAYRMIVAIMRTAPAAAASGLRREA